MNIEDLPHGKHCSEHITCIHLFIIQNNSLGQIKVDINIIPNLQKWNTEA